MKRNVITIATGKELYIDLAINLARSFQLWNKDSGIDFYIVTDLPHLIAKDISKFANVIIVKAGEFGEGFSPKIYLDQFVPDGQNLFIDSDCLIYGSLKHTFELFLGKPVCVIGDYIGEGEWFGDIKKICENHNIRHIPKFNGGVYYLEKGEIATRVYQTAREIENNYDQVGFIRLRNRPNDEVIMALAMELHQQQLLPEDTTIMAEFVNFQSGVKTDIFKGKAVLYNTPGHKQYQLSWPFTEGHPLIVHFLGHHNQLIPYLRDVKLLSLHSKGCSKWASTLLAFLSVTLPYYFKDLSKNLLRPIYHLLFGTRKIQKSERIID